MQGNDKSSLAIITGASRGIGAVIAQRLAKDGFHVALLARNTVELDSVAAKIQSTGGDALPVTCDVSDPASIREALKFIEQSRGTASVLVNNAGFGGPFKRTDEFNLQEWETVLATNLTSAHLFCQALLPQMKERGYGRIVNISSVLGITGGVLSSTYSATKHALIGYTRSVAAEWGRYGITCNAICPGYIQTKMLEANPVDMERLIARIPSQRLGKPEEVASLVLYLTEPMSGYINGSVLVMDGGLTAHISAVLPEF